MSSDKKDVSPAPNGNGADGVAAITDAMQTSSIQELGRKVFVGNLNFATKVEQLSEVFGKHGKISDAQIIFRGTRSLGYGFVTFETCEEAEKAVAATDKVELDGRTVNVEIAKPTPGTPGGAAPRAAAKAAKAASAAKQNGDKKASDEDKENQTDGPEEPRAAKAKRGKGRGRGRTGRGGRRQSAAGSKEEVNGDDQGAATDTSVPNDGDQTGKANAKRVRPGRSKKAPRPDGAPREGRPRRVGPPEGEPSKTLLFVANLPFGLTDEGLKEFFASYQVASAHVVRRRYGSALGKSKGFGFVEFENEDGQLKALEETQGKELEGRALHVKVAVNEAKKEAEEAAKAEGDVPAEAEAPTVGA